MGSTLDALKTGNATIQWVAVVEGLDYLLTDGNAAAALTAWAGLEWSKAIDGLTVKGDWNQRLDPWEAFTPAGTVQLHIQPDPTNDVTAPMFKQAAGLGDVYLSADLLAAATVINVDASAGLTSPVFIGNERITFSGTTALTLTGAGRGRMHPFSTELGTPHQFGVQHRVTASSTNVPIKPIVSTSPRSWIGKWVGLWAHRVVGGVLDTKAQAQCVFAGRIANLADDPNTGCTVLDCRHVVDCIKDTVIGRDTWHANAAEGIRVTAGMRFTYGDQYSGTTGTTANPLDVVVGASGANEMEEGRYTVTDIAAKLNEWLASERDALRIVSNVEFSGPITTSGGAWAMHLKCVHTAATGSDTVWFRFGMPAIVLDALGWDAAWTSPEGLPGIEVRGQGATQRRDSNRPPRRWQLAIVGNGGLEQVDVTDEVGSFEPLATAQMPYALAEWALAGGGSTWGVVRGGDAFYLGKYASGKLTKIKRVFLKPGETVADDAERWGVGADSITFTQIGVCSGAPGDVLVWLLASTGVAGYNSATWDILGGSMSVGVPWSLLTSDFVNSAAGLNSTSEPITVIVDEPMTLADAIGHDLIARRANLVFKNGTLRLARWATPNGAPAEHVLTEANKAAPVGTGENHRSATVLSSNDQRCLVKLKYNRTDVTGSNYRDSITLEDRAAIDDAGRDDKPATIPLRNTFANLGGSATDNIDALGIEFLSSFPLFSRPMRLVTRSVGLPLFEGVAPGDIVSLSDDFARDPDTGLRGLVARKGLLVGHRYDFGGASPGDASAVRDMMGEVVVMLLPDDRTFQYAPAAQVDHTVTGGGFTAGYNSGTLTLRFLANEHTVTSTDLASFVAGDKVRIVEIDPAVAGSELSWARTVSSVSGTDVVISSALAGFDAAKRYRMIPDDYATSTTFQSKAYQADVADSLIVNVARAHQYAMTGFPVRDPAVDTDLPERHAGLDIGDGKPYTCASDRGVARGLNNLRRSKTRHSSAGMFPAAITAAATAAGDYDVLGVKLVRLRPNLGAAARSLEIAPYYRSATGASVTLRITVCRALPNPADAADPDNNLRFELPYQQATWTTSSTTYQTGAAATFSVGTRADDGLAWVIIEGTTNAQTYGLAQCSETVAGDLMDDMAWCKNTDAPHASWITNLLGRLLESERKDQKELFSAHGSTTWASSAAGARIRWRFEARTGTGAARFGVTILAAPPSAKTGVPPTIKLYAKDVVAGTTTSVSFNTGSLDTAAAAFTPLGDCFFGTAYLACSPSTRYQFYFEENDRARIVAAVVYEMPSTVPALYPLLAAGAPIYSAHRTRLLGGVTDALANNGSVLFNWCVDLDASPRTNNTTTARNLLDDTSTAVSANTPGFIPPLANARTLMQTGANVVVAVYGTPPAGGGTVTIKDDTGATVITVTLTAGGALGWYTATGVLPAVDGEKYDIHFVKTVGGGNIAVGAVSIYQYG